VRQSRPPISSTVEAMSTAVEREAARRAFLTGEWAEARAVEVVAPAVVASWGRCRGAGLDPERLVPTFRGAGPDLGKEVFDAFVASSAHCSLVMLDADSVVRSRADGDPDLARLLDGLRVVPGYGFDEASMGTSAATLAIAGRTAVALSGPEHFATALTCLSEAAAPVVDPASHQVVAAVVVVCHRSEESTLQLPLARLLAAQVGEHLAGEPDRRIRLVLQRLRERGDGPDWVVATDGQTMVNNAAARRLDGADLRALGDLLLAGMSLDESGHRHVDLPSAGCADVELEPLLLSGEAVGWLLAAGPAAPTRGGGLVEATRRQGSHVAPVTRRDYAEDLRRDNGPEHAKARIRANRELLTPYLRARHEVAASIRQSRHHLLIGEPGVGKRTLALEQFRRAHPEGHITEVDCGSWAVEADGISAPLVDRRDDRAQLVLLRAMNLLSPVAARRLDEALRPLMVLPDPPLVVGCVDTPAMDATRPYGLLMRHFHEITRIPPLRYRLDEVGDIAWSILRRISPRRSLRLSLQVVRVLEGYAWPGNISELEDVLRYVVARKPIGEVQPPDLPTLCFQSHARRMSMLETAQCDAIIQALYEANGNRYKAAAMLGIARSSLYRKIDAFGISYIA
jgi:sigma-54 dependent transcriptional regulator, acetoin dehydrogenase operon transcriptional activator AcoR